MKYKPKSIDFTKNWEETSRLIDKNFEMLTACDREAKEKGKLVGRYIRHPYADGYAFYQVVKELRASVDIEVCAGLGDDWILPAWGRQCRITKDKALEFITQRDKLEEIFRNKDES